MTLLYCKATKRHYETNAAGDWRHVYPQVSTTPEGPRVSWLVFSEWGSPASFVEVDV